MFYGLTLQQGNVASLRGEEADSLKYLSGFLSTSDPLILDCKQILKHTLLLLLSIPTDWTNCECLCRNVRVCVCVRRCQAIRQSSLLFFSLWVKMDICPLTSVELYQVFLPFKDHYSIFLFLFFIFLCIFGLAHEITADQLPKHIMLFFRLTRLIWPTFLKKPPTLTLQINHIWCFKFPKCINQEISNCFPLSDSAKFRKHSNIKPSCCVLVQTLGTQKWILPL